MNPEISLEYVKENFKNQSEIARQLDISRQAVSLWFVRGEIPKLRQYEIKELANKTV
jgi:predicted transcriptional regulator|tara:strand:- start:2325 stop:2495 length:171 start_codon:yes stop_codon:yes gene_type:complete